MQVNSGLVIFLCSRVGRWYSTQTQEVGAQVWIQHSQQCICRLTYSYTNMSCNLMRQRPINFSLVFMICNSWQFDSSHWWTNTQNNGSKEQDVRGKDLHKLGGSLVATCKQLQIHQFKRLYVHTGYWDASERRPKLSLSDENKLTEQLNLRL